MAGIAWQAVNHLAGLREARLRGLVCRGSRHQPVRSADQQRRQRVRLQRRVSARGDGAARLGRTLGLLGRDQRCLARHVARGGASPLCRGGRADQSVRRDAAARGAHARSGAGHDRHRPGLRADQIRQGRAGNPRLYRRAYAFLHLRRQSRHRFVLAAAVRRAVAPDPAAGRSRSVAVRRRSRGYGEPRCFTTIATWENKGKNIEFEGANYLWSKHVNFVRFLDLPRHRPETCFEMAMLPPDDGVRREVEGNGWRLIDPRPVSADMETLSAVSSPARAASSRSPRTSMSGRTAAGSATAPCATWRAAVPS